MEKEFKVSDDLNKVFFTAKDTSIVRSSQSDPLGIQQIWTYYGSRVVQHLTTRSEYINGFRNALLCFMICNEYTDVKTKRDNEILLEQLSIYSYIAEHIDDDNIKPDVGLVGKDVGRRKYEKDGKNPLISTEKGKTILSNQRANGFCGRYRAPIRSMKIIDKDDGIIMDMAELQKLYGEDSYKRIKSAFKKFVKKGSDKRKFQIFYSEAGKDIVKATFDDIRSCEVQFWKEKLQVVEDIDKPNELMIKCYDLVDDVSLKDGKSLKCFVKDNLLNQADSEEDKAKVNDIIRLENFIRCLEYIFYFALETTSIDNVKSNLPLVFKDQYEICYNDFFNIDMPDEKNKDNTDRINRIKKIKEYCDPKKEYIKGICDYHKWVCEPKQMDREPWLDVDVAGYITPHKTIDDNIKKEKMNLGKWERNYYLEALNKLKNGLK